MATIEFHSNADKVINAKDDAIEKALEAIGIQAEGYAKAKAPVDTGLLRNSITHASGGSQMATQRYTDNKGEKSGSYSGTVGREGDETEYIATNVEYAPYQEYGTRRTPAQPFFRPAVQDHVNEYKRIAETYLKDA